MLTRPPTFVGGLFPSGVPPVFPRAPVRKRSLCELKPLGDGTLEKIETFGGALIQSAIDSLFLLIQKMGVLSCKLTGEMVESIPFGIRRGHPP